MNGRDNQSGKQMILRPALADVARFLIKDLKTDCALQTTFKMLQRQYDKARDFEGELGSRTFVRNVLLKMDEEGLIKIKNGRMSAQILPHYHAIAKRRADAYGHGIPPDISYEEEDEYLISWYRNNFPFGRERYDELKSIQRTEAKAIEITLDEMKEPSKAPIWLTLADLDDWMYFRFDLVVRIQKLQNYLNEYIHSFIDGRMDDCTEFFNYQKHKEFLLSFLRAKLEEGVDTNNVWIIPIKECAPIDAMTTGEHQKRTIFVWNGEDVHFVRPFEAIFALEQEGLIKIKEIEDHSLGSPEHIWGFFLRYKVEITNRGLKILRGNDRTTSDLSPLESIKFSEGIIAYKDVSGHEDNISLIRDNKLTKQGKIFKELWDVRREIKEGKMTKQGDDRSLDVLRQISESGDVKAVKSQIDRINKSCAGKGIAVRIVHVGVNARRLEITFASGT